MAPSTMARSYEAVPHAAPALTARRERQASRPDSSMQTGDLVELSRKLVRRANLRIRVNDPAASEELLMEIVDKYRAWTASMSIHDNSRNYSIRVPSASHEAMLSELTGLGRVLRRSENAEDVTLRYYDLEARLATKQGLLYTFQGYLSRANSIDEIMTVESRIADLQQEIDQIGTHDSAVLSGNAGVLGI